MPKKLMMAATIASAATALDASAQAQKPAPVRHIPVYVEPYYRAAVSPEGTPDVAVNALFDQRLRSSDPAQIRAVEREIRTNPELITPMTMMVLSVRLFDTGSRDLAVFWHYAAKDRMYTIAKVVSAGIEGALTATQNFSSLAGPYINGYAFCDVANQMTQRRNAFEWVKANPYAAIFVPQLQSEYADRRQGLQEAIAFIAENVRKEQEHLGKPETLQALRKARAENGTDALFCAR